MKRLTVLFRPARLVRDRSLDRVLIEGADLRFVSRDNGVPRLAGISLPDTPGAEADLKIPALPVTGFELRTSHLSLETGTGVLQAPLRGTLTQADLGVWVLDAHLGLRYQGARGELALAAWQGQDGALRVEVDLAGVEGWLPEGLDTLGEGRITLGWDGGERFSGNGELAVHLAGSPLALAVQAAKARGEALAFALTLDAADLDLAALDGLAESGADLKGRASLWTRLEGVLPVLSEGLLETASGNGRMSFQIEGGTFPGLVTEASGDLDLDLALSGASLLAVPASPWEVTGRLVSLDPPATFRVSDVAGHALTLMASTDLARWSATGAVGFALEGPSWPRIAGTALGRVEQAPENAFRFALDRLRFDPTRWILDEMEIHMQALDARLAGTTSQVQGRVSTRLDVTDLTTGGDRLTGGRVELRGHLTQLDQGLALTVEDCLSVQAERLDLGEIRWLRPVELCIRQPEERPLLWLDAAGTSSLALTLPRHPVALVVGRRQDPVELADTMPQVKLSAIFDPTDEALKLALDTQGGCLKLPGQGVAVGDIELSLLQGRATSVTLKRSVASSLSRPPDFPALALAGKAMGRWDETMAFEALAQGHKIPLKLSAQGKHHFGFDIGELSYQLDKIRFKPQGLQPGTIVPAVGKLIGKARGSLAVSGGLSWGAGVPATYLRLALRDLGFDAPGLAVRGINTRLERAGPTVHNRLAAQEIRVDLLDIGIPLRNGLIRFHTRKAPFVHIERVSFTWGGGRVQLEPLALRLDQPAAEHVMVLTFNAIRLNSLLQLIPVDGLWGTGSLSGRVPLRVRGSEITIDQGWISAETPGLLRYRPKEKSAFFEHGSETGLLLEALRDFHYQSLSLGLNGKTRDNLGFSISLAGANPDLYDGHPFKLNFDIGGEFDTIIRHNLTIATFAEKFGELMSRYLQ